MGLLITGYVLEPPRVGAANSPFTFTPDVLISNQSAFDTAFPTNESAPRADYLVYPRVDGDLPDARFFWTKNEVIKRFDYDGRNQRFRPMPGHAIVVVGVVAADLNTNRLKVTAPQQSNFTLYPARLSIGTGSGTQLTIALVPDEASFTTPAVGTVQIAQDTGTLNWNTADLTTYAGQDVRFQRQSFFLITESTGRLGLIDEILLLNPIPAAGQFPLIRIGFREYLTPVEVATEGGFSADPAFGTVEWARNTGRLKFYSGDLTIFPGVPIFYDGVVFAFDLGLSPISLGLVNAPGVLTPLPSDESDLFFRIPGVTQFVETLFVDTFSLFGKKNQVEVRRSDGAVQFSLADKAAYGFFSVQAFVPDLPIEKGISLRLFRNPVDPSALDPELKDISAFYESLDSVLADPIIGMPQVLLPAIPVESLSIVVRVELGTGSFIGELPRLDVAVPPTGLGFILNAEQAELRFARRKVNVVVEGSANKPYGTVALPDTLIQESNLVLELETGPGTNLFNTLILDEEVTFDYAAGVATLVNTVGETKASGFGGSFSGTTFTDASQNFTTSGVVQNDLLVVQSGASKGVYTIDTVGTTTLTTDLPGVTESNLLYEVHHGREILADRFFKTIPPLDPNTKVERINLLGTSTNSPRLSIPIDRVAVSRFRLNKTVFLTTVTVLTDGAFTSPALLPSGTVEVSEDTGNLNFSAADLGQDAYWVRKLTIGTEFGIQPRLGFVQLTDRCLEKEEVLITYAILDEDDNKVIVEERAVFSVRKELTLDHPTPVSTLFFNPLAREMAAVPVPRAFRGGRPQVTGEQVTFDVAASSVTFLPSDQVTDALPAGETVNSNERVYVDYYIHEAIGGEQSFTVLQPPMLGVIINIVDGEPSFLIGGNRVAEFPPNFLLRVDKSEVYLLGAATYDPLTDATTVNLQPPQVFQSDQRNPALAVTSGPTRATGTFLQPSYFVTEMATWERVPRGAPKIRFEGDLSRTYVTGIVIHWTDSGDIFHFNIVEGSVFDPETNRTEVTLGMNGVRQYNPGSVTLKRSSNPILPTSAAVASTNRSPTLSLPYLVYRRIEGQVGVILDQPDGYRIDDGGRVTFADPLQDNEELVILYTGARVVEDGRDFRASYTHVVAPNDSNGLAGQILKMDYTTYAPDSFYYRVETITAFRAELAQAFGDEAKATIPSGGPRLENASGPKLHEQGRESLYFPEGHYRNVDRISRDTLKWYNDGIHYMEDALRSMDGRVLGDHDGRFLFDGNINNPVRFTLDEVTNQIDDILKVSDGPPVITFPPLAVSFAGTFKAMYEVSRFSRFYPTRRRLFGVAADPTGLETGDTIVDLLFKKLAAVNQVSRRQPWAVVTEAALTGATVLQVDSADGALDLIRPPFEPTTYDHKVAIVAQDGTIIVNELTPIEVASKTTTSLTLMAPVPSDVPVGATVYQVVFDLLPPAAPFPKYYRLYFDVGANLDEGTLTHIKAFPPFDGSFPGIPVELEIVNPAAGEALDAHCDIFNTLTEPYRFPALDGGTADDDGNRTFPILSPRVDSEGGLGIGAIYRELAIIETSTGTLRTATTSPYVGTGSLDGTATIITNSIAWPAPIPKIHDIVEIRTGLNANSTYHRITAVGASTITVATAFAFVDAGFTFAVSVSNTLETGVAGTFTTTTLTDATKNFITAGVKPGHTVVVTSGANVGLRRQVTTVATTVLGITALPVGGVASYRVDDSLLTFGGAGSILDDELVPALDDELANLDTNVNPYSEQEGIERFFDQFFTNILTSSNGQTFSGTTLTDTTVNFINAGVDPSHFVYIRFGASAGIFQVSVVNSATSLDITESFPGTVSGISYRIVDGGGLPLKALQDAFGVLKEVDQAITDTTAFRTIVTTAVAVIGDASAFARRTVTSDLDSRETQVNNRISDLEDPGLGHPVVLSSVLSSTGNLYDKRYVWIDARINLKKGSLVRKKRAVDDRLEAEKEIIKQLTKLLTT